MIRTFGIDDGTFGFVVNRSVSSPTRSTAASAGAAVTASSAISALCLRALSSVFIVMSSLRIASIVFRYGQLPAGSRMRMPW